MDGNFAAEHQRMKNPEDDVWLADGDGFFVGRTRFDEHVRTAVERVQVRYDFCGSVQSVIRASSAVVL